MNEKIRDLLDRAKAEYVTCAYADLNGDLRGHLVGRKYFESIADSGLALVPEAMVLGTDDQIYVPEGYLSLDLPFSDQKAFLANSRPRTLPDYPAEKNLLFFLDFPEESPGALWSPRQLHARALERLGALGYAADVGAEYEFRVFDESEQSARDKGFKNLQTALPRSGYMNVIRQSQGMDFISGLLDMCRAVDIEVASVHWEHGPAMLEVALKHETGMQAADNAVLFKACTKSHATRRGCLASFMAKPILEEDGASNHIHISLVARNGRNVFHDARAAHGMSDTLRHFIGGVQKLLPEMMLMVAPNPNSWRRFVPDAFAPLAADWGIENRTTALRMIPGGKRSQRVEFRAAGADTNPYLVQACAIAMGTWGIEHQLEPRKPVEGSAYLRRSRTPKSARFPAGFKDAISAFRGSKAARELFGDDFVEMFAGTRQALFNDLADKRGRISHQREISAFLAGA